MAKGRGEGSSAPTGRVRCTGKLAPGRPPRAGRSSVVAAFGAAAAAQEAGRKSVAVRHPNLLLNRRRSSRSSSRSASTPGPRGSSTASRRKRKRTARWSRTALAYALTGEAEVRAQRARAPPAGRARPDAPLREARRQGRARVGAVELVGRHRVGLRPGLRRLHARGAGRSRALAPHGGPDDHRAGGGPDDHAQPRLRRALARRDDRLLPGRRGADRLGPARPGRPRAPRGRLLHGHGHA